MVKVGYLFDMVSGLLVWRGLLDSDESLLSSPRERQKRIEGMLGFGASPAERRIYAQGHHNGSTAFT